MTTSRLAIEFAVRNMLRQRGRTAITLAAVILGVIGLMLSGGFVEDIFVQLRESSIQSRLGHFQIYRKGFYENSTKQPYRYLINKPDQLTSYLGNLDGVAVTMKRLNFIGLLNNGRTDLPIIGEGIEASKEAANLGGFFSIVDGRQLSDDDAYGIMLGEGVASSLGIKIGDPVNITATMADGGLNSLEFEVVGVFRTFSKEFDARAVRVSLDASQELSGAEGVHAVVTKLADTGKTDALAGALKTMLADKGYELKTWIELDNFYVSTVELYKAQLGVLQLIILFVVFLSVGNSVNMTAYERIGEFGTLKALGRTSRDIQKLLIVENVMIGLAGAVLGVLLGALCAWAISSVGITMPPPPNSNTSYTAYIRIVPGTTAVAFAVGFLATFLSAIVAARKASSVLIVDALRENI